MKLLLISNNEIVNNLYFEDETNIEVKKKFRPLNKDGEKEAIKLMKNPLFVDVERIYVDASNSAISSAKYVSDKLDLDLIVNKKLYDCKIGELGNKSVKMLGYFQEHDFDFKLSDGESLNECGTRINSFIKKVINEGYESVAVFLPKRCILAFLIKYTDYGYNLDDKLILIYNEEVILGDCEKSIDIFEIEYIDGNIKNIICH